MLIPAALPDYLKTTIESCFATGAVSAGSNSDGGCFAAGGMGQAFCWKH